MPKIISISQKKHFIKDFLKSFLGLDLFDRLMLVVFFLIIAVTPYIIANNQIFTSKAATSLVSINSGNWSDPLVWSTGVVPKESDTVGISGNHVINYDVGSSKIAGVTVDAGSQLVFDSTKSVTLESNGNVVVNGTLVIKPASFVNIHTLRFTGANENAFVGGGMDVIDADVGLWVMEQGKLDIQGAVRSGWARATNSLSANNTSVVLDQTPTGWQVGDEILVVPTALGATDGGEVRTISAISGNTITLSSGLSNTHPTVSLPDGKTLGAEVANLTRNVRIEGMPPSFPFPDSSQNNSPGRSHIFIRNASPVVHNIKYAAIRYMGPRKFHFLPETDKGTDFVIGRYGLHFHMSSDNNRGSLVEGVVARDIGSHSFVPHGSHGITFKDTVSYNSANEAYWWDPRADVDSKGPNPNATNDILYDHALAAYVNIDPNLSTSISTNMSAFVLDEGVGDTLRDSVAVAVHGGQNSSGFTWPESANNTTNNVWTFHDNIAHNNVSNGIFTWQNTTNNHVVDRFTGYHNLNAGLDHGAYVNNYNYDSLVLFENGTAEVQLHSNSGGGQKLNNFKVATSALTALELLPANLPGSTRTELKNWNITKLGASNKAIKINDAGNPGDTPPALHEIDLICWILPGSAELEQSNFDPVNYRSGTIIRVQRRNNTAYQFENGIFTDIASFAAACDAAPFITPTPTPTLTQIPTPTPSITPILIPTSTPTLTAWGDILCVIEGVATLKCIPAVIKIIIQYLLIFAGIVAVFLIIHSGSKFVLSSGDPKKVEEARNTLVYAVLGIIIIAAAYLLVNLASFVTGVKCLKFIDFNCI